MWKIISVVNAVKSFNEWNPHACIGLKLSETLYMSIVYGGGRASWCLTAILTNSVTKGCGTVCVDLSCGTKSVPTEKKGDWAIEFTRMSPLSPSQQANGPAFELFQDMDRIHTEEYNHVLLDCIFAVKMLATKESQPILAAFFGQPANTPIPRRTVAMRTVRILRVERL